MFRRKYREIYNFFCTSLKELYNGKIITYKLKFVDSFRFMSSSLLSLVDRLSQGHDNKKRRKCKPCLEYISIKDSELYANA